MLFRSGSRIALSLLVMLFCGRVAQAATFAVDPISLTLVKSNSSGTIAVVNQSATKLRLQVTGFAWAQSLSGQIELSPTDDLIFFPKILTLDPGQTARIRVGVTAAQGSSEKTYRVFMEELPSLASVIKPAVGASLTIRMKVGVPIFLDPITPPTFGGAVRNAAVSNGALAFDIVNTGNAHFSIADVHVVGKNAAGGSVVDQNATGWYVLAGGTRHFVLPLSKDRCAALASVAISIKTDAGPLGASFADLSKDCSAIPHR